MRPLDGLKKIRREKLEKLKKAGINPYPVKSKRTHTVKDALSDFDKLVKSKKAVALVGRIRAIRGHGKSTFINIQDGTGNIQAYLKQDKLGREQYEIFENFDIGDFIQVAGTFFKTKKGEKTILANKIKILAKSLLPLPEKWHGLSSKEIRFRKRYLDLVMNPKVKEIFKTRSRIICEIRAYLEQNGFIGVETPILQPIPGGASARPFITHHNALDIDFYLRISPELYLKRLIVGGFEKVYEIGRAFRNEGMDREHSPDFTICEFYWAYQDYEGLMKFTEEMISRIVKKIIGKTKIKYQGKTIDFKPPWKKKKFADLIYEKTKIDILKIKNPKVLADKIKKLGIKLDPSFSYAKLVDLLFKEKVRGALAGPLFVTDHPIELEPLAKKNPDGKTVQRFQPVVAGFELLKAYTELNDPLDQLERFRVQEKEREKGDEEAQFIDQDFIEALEYGMPPTAGWGMGIDRFVALLTDAPSLRDAILFPLMRPKK